MKQNSEYHLAGTSESIIISRNNNGIFAKILARVLIGIGLVFCMGIVIVSLHIVQSNKAAESYLNERHNYSSSRFHHDNSSVLDDTVLDHAGQQQEAGHQSELSQEQQEAIHRLRLEVGDMLTSEFMKTDIYLQKWLKASNWDVEETAERLLDHLDWREEYDMDSVLEANFTFFEKEFPLYNDGVDYQGAPVVSMNIAEWDLRAITVGGYEREWFRYFCREFEYGIKKGEEIYVNKAMNVAQMNGVTQGMFILNLDNFSLTKHGCFSCIRLIARVLLAMDENYPGWLHHSIVINASDLEDAVIEMALPLLNGDNRGAVLVYGKNKAEWQQKILSLTAPNQIRPEFGGTKTD